MQDHAQDACATGHLLEGAESWTGDSADGDMINGLRQLARGQDSPYVTSTVVPSPSGPHIRQARAGQAVHRTYDDEPLSTGML
ncbi:hypothetical protein OPT61_g1433 [Boeremia exigua]|uniref:Uncharacterized protein n=1 Tax=Boeremia exigua TaxID=749465 RepID=A0ACC2IQ47_9PLEO|nr:hypothetical protein OPT61_g1433 [Boeremia exigua]